MGVARWGLGPEPPQRVERPGLRRRARRLSLRLFSDEEPEPRRHWLSSV